MKTESLESVPHAFTPRRSFNCLAQFLLNQILSSGDFGFIVTLPATFSGGKSSGNFYQLLGGKLVKTLKSLGVGQRQAVALRLFGRLLRLTEELLRCLRAESVYMVWPQIKGIIMLTSLRP